MVSTKEFVQILWRKNQELEAADWQQLSARGKADGWLEPLNLVQAEKAIERRTAAGILHRFLQKVLREADLPSWEEAKKLRDLYDCRTCVNHVAQVYCKGIMDGVEMESGELIFDMYGTITAPEAEEMAERMLYPEMRRGAGQKASILCREKEFYETQKSCVPKCTRNLTPNPVPNREGKLTSASALKWMQQLREQKGNFLLLDVRPDYEFQESHLSGAVSVPLFSLMKKMEKETETAIWSDWEKDQTVLIYCEQGYQSEIAAQYLKENGFANVFWFAYSADNTKDHSR